MGVSVDVYSGQERAFPDVKGGCLTGAEVALPVEFGEGLSVVCVSYYQSQSVQVRTWEEALEGVELEGVARYDVMVMPELNPMLRMYMDNGLRTQHEARRFGRVFAVYTDKEAFNASLGVDGDGSAHVLLVSNGVVLASESGAFSEEGARRLLECVGEWMNQKGVGDHRMVASSE